MGLYKEWTDMVVEYVKTKGEAAFWSEYAKVEGKIYSKVLSNHKEIVKGQIGDLAKEYDVDVLFFMGFLDGISESLNVEVNLDELTRESEITLDINLENLYYNMLDAKADYLYELPQWDAIFSQEKRKEIHAAWKGSKTVVNENKIGRNDPCTCGSNKKYKKCCGK